MHHKLALAFGALALASDVSALFGRNNSTFNTTSTNCPSCTPVVHHGPYPMPSGMKKPSVNPHNYFTLPGRNHTTNHTTPVARILAPTGHANIRTGIQATPLVTPIVASTGHAPFVTHSFQNHTSPIKPHVHVPSGNASITVTRPCSTCPISTISGSNSRAAVYKPCPTCPPITTSGSTKSPV